MLCRLLTTLSFVAFEVYLFILVGCVSTSPVTETRDALALQIVTPTPFVLSTEELQIVERAKQYLREHIIEHRLKEDLSDLVPTQVETGPSADVVRFQQMYQGLPVYGGGLLILIPHNPDSEVTVGNTYNSRFILRTYISANPNTPSSKTSITPKISAQEAVALAMNSIGAKALFRYPVNLDLLFYPAGRVGNDTQYALAWDMALYPIDVEGEWIVYVDAINGEVLYRYNLAPHPSTPGILPTKPNPHPTTQPPPTIYP